MRGSSATAWRVSGCTAMTRFVRIRAKGQTIKGRIWTYGRDDRPFGGCVPAGRALLRIARSAAASMADLSAKKSRAVALRERECAIASKRAARIAPQFRPAS